jgi:ring-1,2-phenylacetyl-CoA epoxidase subunit PaaC
LTDTSGRTSSSEALGDVPAAVTGALRNLLLCLADSKRLLGVRYSDCLLGAPSLETGIAAASMAQDEWGHSRLTYALLADFGEDPKFLEHEREPPAYHSMESLDQPLDGFAAFIAAALVLDSAITTQYRAMGGSAYEPLRNRVQKLLDEEVMHERFAFAWAEQLHRSGARNVFATHLRTMTADALMWFGPASDTMSALLLDHQMVAAGPDELRRRWLEGVAPVLVKFDVAREVGVREETPGVWGWITPLEWVDWDPDRRRSRRGGPDGESLARVRGDRNRWLLPDW